MQVDQEADMCRKCVNICAWLGGVLSQGPCRYTYVKRETNQSRSTRNGGTVDILTISIGVFGLRGQRVP